VHALVNRLASWPEIGLCALEQLKLVPGLKDLHGGAGQCGQGAIGNQRQVIRHSPPDAAARHLHRAAVQPAGVDVVELLPMANATERWRCGGPGSTPRSGPALCRTRLPQSLKSPATISGDCAGISRAMKACSCVHLARAGWPGSGPDAPPPHALARLSHHALRRATGHAARTGGPTCPRCWCADTGQRDSMALPMLTMPGDRRWCGTPPRTLRAPGNRPAATPASG